VNWLLYYRECLFGKSLDQILAEREQQAAAQQQQLAQSDKGSKEQVSALPSEKWFQELRLDERPIQTGKDQ